MSMIASAADSGMRVMRVAEPAMKTASPAAATPAPTVAGASARSAAPAADVVAADGAATFNAHRVRQIVQQINAAAVYGASVSVVSTATTIHATIDISG